MKRNIFSIAILAFATIIFAAIDAKAQLPEGNIGIGASIGPNNGAGQLYFAPTPDIDLALTLGYQSITPEEGDASTLMRVGAQFRYLFLEPANTIDPYIAIDVNYYDDGISGDMNGIGFGAAYGLQAELVKNVFLMAQLGIGYTMVTDNQPGDIEVKSSSLNFGGSRLGAIIYMQD